MNISRATVAATMPLFLSTIGADKCGPYWPSGGGSAPPAPSQQPTKPFCETDPTIGCRVQCTDVNIAKFFACDGFGPLEMKFVDDVNKAMQDAVDQGKTFCTLAEIGVTVKPCDLGIVPTPVQFKDCMPAPPGCVL